MTGWCIRFRQQRRSPVEHVAVVVWAIGAAILLNGSVYAQTAPGSQPIVSSLAYDGGQLARESFATRASFATVWGDRAAARWIEEHNAALGSGQSITAPRVVYFTAGPFALPTTGVDALIGALAQEGYVAGSNLKIEWRSAEGRNDAIEPIASEIVASKPDLIVVVGSTEGAAIKRATTTIPVVMTSVSDPLAAGLVASFEHPGGNVTGLTNTPIDVFGKRLQALKDTVPGLTRVAVLRSTTNPGSVGTFQDAKSAGTRLGLDVFAADVTRIPEDLPVGFDAALSGHAEAMLIVPETLFNVNRARIAELAIQRRLPVIAPGRAYTDSGVLMSYGPNGTELSVRAGGYVAKVLRGAKPADLPVGAPEQIEFVVNLKTAEAIGLTLPNAVRERATDLVR